MTMLPSHDGDGAAKATWLRCDVDVESCWRQCCWVIQAMALLRQLGHNAISMSSHDGDNVVESRWRQPRRGDLAVTRCRCRVMLVTMLLSHDGDGAAEVTWPWCDVDAKSYWR
jgi:hypothetical protein